MDVAPQSTANGSARRTAWTGAWLLLVLLACSRGREPESASAPVAGGTLRVAVLDPFDFLTPVRAIQPTTYDFMVHVTPPLGRVTEQGSIQWLLGRPLGPGPDLAFRLRHARWEDGQPVTARDLVLTTQVMLHPGTPGQERARFGLVRDVVAADDSTLLFHLLDLSPYRFRDALVMPLPAHLLGESPDPRRLLDWPITRKPISCGPFRVVESTTTSLVLERHAGSGFRDPYLDRVEVKSLGADAAIRGFRNRELDVIDGVPADRVEDVRRMRGARVVALVGASYLFMGWNLRDARFADLEVRRAAAEAVDIPRLIRDLTLGQADPARGPLVPALGVEDTLRTLAHDPRSARHRLQAAGWRDQDGDGALDKGGATLDFHLIVNADDLMRRQAAEGIARDLAHVGIRVLVRALPEEEFAARLESGQFEAFMGRWFPELGPGLERVWGSELASFNYGGFADGRVDTLLHQLRYELQDSRRLDLLAALQARVYALQPYLFLFQEPHFAAFAARVRGVKPAVVSTFWNLPEWWVADARPRAGGAAERRSRRRRRRGAARWRVTAGTCRPPADPT